MADVRAPYTPETDPDGRPYVDGPGNGLGYSHGTLFPHMRPKTKSEALVAARIANEAYKQGYLQARADIRDALGISA